MRFNFKNAVIATMTGTCVLLSQFIFADPVLLYDATGKIAAVVDTTGNSPSNVYLATSGDPVGYVYSDGAVYSYSGRHLGWYSDGVIWDTNGYMMAFGDKNKPAAVQITTGTPAVLKTTVPAIVPTREVVTKPVFVNEISPTPFNAVYTIEPVD